MRFASLGSGSEGNALVVEAGPAASPTRVLLDCGFGIAEVQRRLDRLGLAPADLDAVFVTHEHGDHIGSAYGFCARHGLALYMSHGTHAATATMAGPRVTAALTLSFCVADEPIAIGDLLIAPYTVPHDAREPLQFVFGDGQRRLGVLTDAGMSTPYLIERLRAVDALVLECNHDRAMLAGSAYPAGLKARIGGEFGHLANETAAQILAAIHHPRLQHVAAAHLSQQNNTPILAAEALAGALGADPEDIAIADQHEGLAWHTVA